MTSPLATAGPPTMAPFRAIRQSTGCDSRSYVACRILADAARTAHRDQNGIRTVVKLRVLCGIIRRLSCLQADASISFMVAAP